MKKTNMYHGKFKLRHVQKIFRVMKITSFLLLIAFIQVSAATTYSQSTKLNLNYENVKLSDLLDKIEKASDYRFFYNSQSTDLSKTVSINSQDSDLKEVLDKVLGSNLTYEMVNNNIVVIKSTNAGMEELSGTEQQKSISGKVTDSSGEGLPGVSVVVKGTTTGVITDMDGKYSLLKVPGNATLQFSFVGMKTQEISVGTKTIINVILAEEAVGIEEVVAVGYGTQKRATITGSVATIQGNEIVNIPVANVSSSLAGKLPGVVAVQRSGEPGRDNASINIRGFGNALIIVDGVEQSFNQLDPNEIESFSILKDASAAIYGARAAHGVILVTTKRGNVGKAKINFSSNLGWQTRTTWPRMANAGEFTSLINQGRINQGQPLKYTEYDVKVFKYISGDKDILAKMTADELARFNDEDLRNYIDEDPYSAAFNTWAPMQQYNLSSRGGNENIKYFVSGGFLNQASMLKSGDTKFKRYNIRGNIDARITKNLNIGVDLSGRYEQRNYPLADITWIMQLTYWGEPVRYKVWPDPAKPVGSIVDASNADLTGYQKYDYKEYNSSLSFDYQTPFLKGLTVKGRLDYRVGFYYNNFFSKQYWTYNYDFKTDTYTQATSPSGKTALTIESREDDWLTAQLFLNYEKTFGKHEVKAMLAYEGIESKSRYVSAYREGYLSTALQNLNAGGDLNKNNSGVETEAGRASYIGRLNYSYANKYLLEGTFRNDGNSMWAGDYRWGFFPGVLVGWRLSEEGFIKNNVSFIDNLKLRGSLGVSGDDYGGVPYQYLATFGISGKYIFNNAIGNGIKNNGLANPYGTWAEYKTYNVGIDFSLLKNKLYGEADAFYRYGYHLLGYRADALPTTFGASFPAENLNSSSNRGFELKIGHQNTIGEFKYTIEGNVSWNRAKWEHYEERDFSEATPDVKARDMVSGRWRNTVWGYKAAGLFQNQDEIDNWPVNQDGNGNKTIRPGDIKYLDLNDDGKLNQYDETAVGNQIPLTMFGLNITANWKRFDLSLLAQGAASFKMYVNEERVAANYEGNTYAYIANDSWTTENTDATFPRFVPGGAPNNKPVSTFWMHDASYVRLKNMQVGYTIPETLMKKAGLESCRFYLSGVNLFTISRLKAFDPEAPIGDLRYYPQQKTYSIGVNLSF